MVVIATAYEFGLVLIYGCQEVENPPFVDTNGYKRICISVVSWLRTRKRRGDRAVEGARLEIVCTPNKGTGGSNPPLSATFTYEKLHSDGLVSLLCTGKIVFPLLLFCAGFVQVLSLSFKRDDFTLTLLPVVFLRPLHCFA